MTAGLLTTGSSGILYDAQSIASASAALFDASEWQHRGKVRYQRGGRGSVAFIEDGEHAWVLRHYLRGGWIAKLVRDRYTWTGAERTRSFREWRLLEQMKIWGLPVPTPIAARYERSFLTYRADLITAQLRETQSLAALIRVGTTLQVWKSIGRTIAQFHLRGVHHADLNAHNILIDAAQQIYLLDFDRGRIRARGSWEDAVLARLRRSLDKLARQDPAVRFDESMWQTLLTGYRVQTTATD
jgi:3-deoxy-D-manno-octulosonic acid kinase